MQVHKRVTIAAAVAIGAGGALVAVPTASLAAGAASSPDRVRVVTEGLDDPFGLKKAVGRGGLLVGEGTSGEVTRVFFDGRQETVLDGVPGVAGVAGGPRRVFAVTGEEVAPGGKVGASKVVRMDYRGGHVKVIADLLKHELKNNPDGQVQFVDGEPVDALSNPFGLTWSRFGLFVADGGANDVLKVHPGTGKVTTFFAPKPFRTTPECQSPDANANPGTKGCDPVATGVQVRRGSVFVSFLGAEAPGAGRVYKLDARTGEVQRVWKGFTSPTGVAVKASGTVFVSHVLEGAPAGPPGPDFDPATVGEITRIKDGKRTHAQVTMPTGMTVHRGRLYSTAFSIGSYLGLEHAGRVVLPLEACCAVAPSCSFSRCTVRTVPEAR
jgi:hypothetical protein